jgi:hypothetical protein
MGFLQRFYTQGKMALVGTGVDHEELVAQGRNFIPFDETDFNMEKAVYHGGLLLKHFIHFFKVEINYFYIYEKNSRILSNFLIVEN